MSNLNHVKFALTVAATAALTEGQAVGFDGAVCAAGAEPLGFAANDAIAGDDVAANITGLLSVKAGANITKGAALEVGANGTVVPHDTGVIVAYAYEAAASGKFVRVVRK